MLTSRPLFIALSLALSMAAAQAQTHDKVAVSTKLVRPVAASPVAARPAAAPARPAVNPADDSERQIWRHHGVG